MTVVRYPGFTIVPGDPTQGPLVVHSRPTLICWAEVGDGRGGRMSCAGNITMRWEFQIAEYYVAAGAVIPPGKDGVFDTCSSRRASPSSLPWGACRSCGVHRSITQGVFMEVQDILGSDEVIAEARRPLADLSPSLEPWLLKMLWDINATSIGNLLYDTRMADLDITWEQNRQICQVLKLNQLKSPKLLPPRHWLDALF